MAEMEMMRTIMKVELVEFKNRMACEGMREREREKLLCLSL